uniref:Protein phosphatase n=1 Tax=Kalanchoe fedtschenkoi TaxID=63787 RepID=A0A7N0UMF9_KALFE
MPPLYFSKLTALAQHGNHGRDTALKALIGFITEQGKIVLGNSRFFYSIPAAALTELRSASRNGSSFIAKSDPNQRMSPSIVGAISRTMSIPSVSGQSYQVFGYHIDQLVGDVVGLSISPKGIILANANDITCARKAMLINSFVNSLTAKSGNMPVSVSHGNILCHNQHSGCFRRQHVSSMRQEVSAINLVHKQMVFNAAVRIGVRNSCSCGGFRGFHTSTFASVFAGAASEASLDNNFSGDVTGSPAASSEQSIPLEKPLKLLCGSCYLPHPDKEETGGEDAHFICLDKQVIGVADGVGGWADLGVDAGIYSRELMANAVAAIQEEPVFAVDPARVLEKAHAKTKAKGSSTACIIALTDQGLHAINLGDSGFVVIRDGSTVFKSPVQQHDFNFTYQLESGSSGDQPSSGEVFKIPVSPGDVIVAGTDGLFDNLYNNEISGVVVHSVRAGFGPQVAAQKIAALARERALDKNRQTPFATAAQDAGFRYHGGKLDDITVIVSYITRSTKENGSTAKLE